MNVITPLYPGRLFVAVLLTNTHPCRQSPFISKELTEHTKEGLWLPSCP